MKIGDKLALFTCGYSKEQIGEIDKIYANDESVLDAAKQLKSFEELKSFLPTASEPGPQPPADPAPSPGAENEPKPEQSNELEALKQEKAELERQLKQAQDANASKDNSGGAKDPEDAIIDFFNSI